MATGLLGLLVGTLVAPFMTSPVIAATGINKQVNFQGKVVNTNGTNVTNGSYTFVFKLYTVASGGSAVWTESKSLTVTDGVFQTQLGDTTSLPGSVNFNTDNIYLGITFHTDSEMSPRIQFTAAAYAFNSDTLDGLDASAFAQLNPGSAQSGSLNVTGSVQAATSLQAPLVDTATAVALGIGTGTASSVTVGRATSSNAVTIQGSAASTWVVTGASGTTTLSFANPTTTNAIQFPNAGGTVCTTVASTCNATYQAAGNYLAKNANDTSTAAYLGQLYTFTNSNTGASGVLSLSGAGTASTLSVSSSANASASNALILANNTNGTPSGNLIDLQVGGASRFSVNTAGAVSTSSTINSQTISATANFTGTVTIASTATINGTVIAPLYQTADGTGASAALTLRSGTTTAGSGLSTGSVTIKSGDGSGTSTSSGNVTLDSGAKTSGGFAGTINIGDTNAPNINIGHNGSTPSVVSIQGLAGTGGGGSTLIMSAGSFATTVNFTTPTANNTITFPNAGGTVCTTTAATCNATYQAAGSYLLQNPASNNASTSNFAGYQYSFTQSSTGAAGNVSLTNAGTNSALSIAQNGTPVAGQAALLVNAATGVTGNLIDLQLNAVSRFKVDTTGAVTTLSTINGQTISSAASFTGTVTSAQALTVSAGGIAVTGNSNVTGTLGVSSTLTVSAGGAAITGNSTITGTLGGITNLTLSGTISGGTTYSASTALTAPLVNSADTSTASTPSAALTIRSGNATGTTSSSGAVSIDSGTATGTKGTVSLGTSNASAINIGNSSAPFTVQGNAGVSGSKLIFGNTTVDATTSGTAATYRFAAPTSATTYTICTTDLTSCGTSSTGYLRKGVANETSGATLTAGQSLYTFSNSGGQGSNVLVLDQGTGTASTLKVVAAANASAGDALIYAKLTNASVSGNLMDLWSGASGGETSKFSVSAAGALTTASTINGQTIGATSSLAIVNTSGLLTANAGLTVNSALATFNNGATVASGVLTVTTGGASITGGINNNAGGITGAGAVSGLSSLQFNTAGSIDANSAVALTIGTTNASAITMGRAGATLSLQGNTSTSLVASNGTNTITARFQNPSANVIYEFGNATAGTYQLCSTYATTCNTTYAAYYAAGYVQLAPGSAQADASTNPSIWINKSTVTTNNLIRLQAAASDVFTVQANGNLTSTGVASLGGGVMSVDSATFKVKVGTGTPTLGNPGSAASAALYVTGTTELANLVKIGDNTNNSSFDATTKELTFSGTARHTKAIRLTAEYAGAVLDADGTLNTGTMTAGLDQTPAPDMGYYKWTTGQAATQDYDVVVSVPIPDDYAAWTGTPSFMTYGTGTGSAITATVYDTAGTVSNVNATALTVSGTWTARTTSLLTGTYTQGSTMLIRIHMSAGTSADTRIGTITIPYLSRW